MGLRQGISVCALILLTSLEPACCCSEGQCSTFDWAHLMLKQKRRFPCGVSTSDDALLSMVAGLWAPMCSSQGCFHPSMASSVATVINF